MNLKNILVIRQGNDIGRKHVTSISPEVIATSNAIKRYRSLY